MWLDEILRAAWGLCCCYPAMRLTQRFRLKALPTTVVITLYMIPTWKVYAWLMGWLCG